MKKFYMILVLDLLFVIPVFCQTTISVNPVKDNTIYANFPDNSNGSGINFFAGSTNAGSARRALLKFDLSAIPSCATITSVTLTLNCNRVAPAGGIFNISLHKLLEDWGEGTTDAGDLRDGDGMPASLNDATWNCAFSNGGTACNIPWSIAGAAFTAGASATTPVGPANANYSWSGAGMEADVQSWVANPGINFGWILLGPEPTVGSAKRFGSREQATPALRPVLTITYTCNVIINLKVFLEGYYTGGIMQPVRLNQGVPGATAAETDEITAELHAGDFSLTASSSGILQTDGTVALSFPSVATPQYIVVKHRNSIETWSAVPVIINSSTLYDFTDAASKAFGDNLKNLGGVWGIFTGDLNQDGFVDGNDFPPFDIDSFNGVNSIYVATDMNGDGFVDGNDFPAFDSNSFSGVSSVHP